MEKTALSSLDIKVLVEELQWIAKSQARIQKIYQLEDEVHIEFFVSNRGTFLLVLGDGKIFIKQHKCRKHFF